MVDEPETIQPEWFDDAQTVGICGATSTPKWLMEACLDTILNLK
jgi:4-hydroxy-3-methylbut-2-enyl diphosphate reductase